MYQKDRVRIHVPVLVVSSLLVVGKRREVGGVRDHDVRRVRKGTKSNRHLDVKHRGRRGDAEQLNAIRTRERLANVNEVVEIASPRGRGRAYWAREDEVKEEHRSAACDGTAQRTVLKQMWITNPLERNERAESHSDSNGFRPSGRSTHPWIPSGLPSADITVPNSVA